MIGSLRDTDVMGQCLLESIANFSSSYISAVVGCKEKRKKIAKAAGPYLQAHTPWGKNPQGSLGRFFLPQAVSSRVGTPLHVAGMLPVCDGGTVSVGQPKNAPIRDVFRVTARNWKYPLSCGLPSQTVDSHVVG